jgi:SAM-dependent methyltransferase
MSSYAWHLAEPRHPEKSNRTQAPSTTSSAAAAAAAPDDATPATDRHFTKNQRVYVFVHSERDTGAGTIEATPDQLEGPDRERFAGRYRVRFDETYQDGRSKRAHVRPARLQAVLRPPPPQPLRNPQAVVTPCTDEFRRQARAQLSCGRDRRVLEIGCSTGEASAVIAQHLCGYESEAASSSEEEDESEQQVPSQRQRVWSRGLVAVDLASDALEQARRRVPPPRAKFLLADVLAEPSLLAERLLGRRRAAQGAAVSALFLDIGGKRAIADVVAAVDALTRVLRPELVVVKSEELAASAREWKAGGRQEEGQEEGDAGEWRGEGAPADAVPDPQGWWRHAQQQRRPRPPRVETTTTTGAATAATTPSAVDVPPWYPRLVVRKRRAGLDSDNGSSSAAPPAPVPPSSSNASAAGCWLGVRPQRLPQRLAPGSGTTYICRFSNYGRCLRHEAWLLKKQEEDGKGDCPYDHGVCHACLAPGHRAVDAACPVASAAYAAAAREAVAT